MEDELDDLSEPAPSPEESAVPSRIEEKTAMKREIGIFSGVNIVVGCIIGSGIFVSPVGVLKNMRCVGLSLAMWGITGVFSLVGALVYAELAVTIPRSGGEYIYILTAFGALPAFLCLWITLVVLAAGGVSANALVFAEYVLRPIFLNCTVLPALPKTFLALVSLITLIVVNCLSVVWSSRLCIFLTFGKVSATLGVIGLGFYSLAKGNVESFSDSLQSCSYSLGEWSLAFYNGFWAFQGWSYLNFLTEEMKNPARDFPIVILISLTIVTAIYLLVNVAYLAVLSPLDMLLSTAVAVTFAKQTMGIVAPLMPAAVSCSVLGSMNGNLLSMSRMPFTGAREGHMPSIMAMVSYHFNTPLPSILFLFILCVIFILTAGTNYLIQLTGFAFCFVSSLAVGSLLYLRYTQPNLPRPIKLPLFFPIAYLITCFFILVMSFYEQPIDGLVSVSIILSGVPVYLFGVSWGKKPKSVQNKIDKVQLALQKLFMVVQLEEDEEEAVAEAGEYNESVPKEFPKEQTKKKRAAQSFEETVVDDNGNLVTVLKQK